MNKTQAYINTNKDRFLNELLELLRIPSVSADSSFNNDVQKCADTLSENLKNIGLSNVHVYPTAGHPIVYGEKIIDASKPNFLIGCNVTSQALSGVRQKLTKSGVVFRTALYSGK